MASVQFLQVTSSRLKTTKKQIKMVEMNVLIHSISENPRTVEPKDHDERTDGTACKWRDSSQQSKVKIIYC